MPNTSITNSFSANTRIRSAAVNANFTDTITYTGCHVTLAAQLSNLTNNVDTLLDFDTETWDEGDNFDTGNNRFVVPVTGYYKVIVCATFINTIADTFYRTMIFKGGSAVAQNIVHTASTASVTSLIHVDYVFTAGDFIYGYVKSNSGGNTVDVTNTGSLTYMNVLFLGT